MALIAVRSLGTNKQLERLRTRRAGRLALCLALAPVRLGDGARFGCPFKGMLHPIGFGAQFGSQLVKRARLAGPREVPNNGGTQSVLTSLSSLALALDRRLGRFLRSLLACVLI